MSTSVQSQPTSAMDRILGRAVSYGLAQPEVVNQRPQSVILVEQLRLLADLNERISSQQKLLMVLNTRDSDSTQSELPEEAKNRVLQTLEQMNVNLEEFLAHVSTLLEKKEHITNYLQTPFSSDYLLVEAEHQSNFLQLFRDVSQFILGLPTTISAIEWAANLHIGESQLDRKLWSLCALLAKCQRYHDAVNQWSELYRELL